MLFQWPKLERRALNSFDWSINTFTPLYNKESLVGLAVKKPSCRQLLNVRKYQPNSNYCCCGKKRDFFQENKKKKKTF